MSEVTFETVTPEIGMTLDEMEAVIQRARELGATGEEVLHVDTKVIWTLKRKGSSIKRAHVMVPDHGITMKVVRHLTIQTGHGPGKAD